jgi:hypothetical protein
MTILKAPAGTLTDGVVELRLPSPDAGDIATIDQYVEDEQLDGGWLPDVPLVTGERLVKDWLDCWNGRPGRDGAAFTFVVTVPGGPRFIGVVGVAEGDDGAFGLSYGTAPDWRGTGTGQPRYPAGCAVGGQAARSPYCRGADRPRSEGQRTSGGECRLRPGRNDDPGPTLVPGRPFNCDTS